MENHERPQSSFLQAFFGSFLGLKAYPRLAERSLGSVFAHFFVLIALVCSLYAMLGAQWLKVHVEPYLQNAAQQLPAIEIKNGVASTKAEEPYILRIEKEPILVIDTTGDKQAYLDKYPAIMVLSATEITTKDSHGKVESYKLAGNFQISPEIVQGWIATVAGWTLPILFLLAAAWQFCWKGIQVLLVATVATLANQSRPSFATHLRLATFACGPAMAWGLAVFALELTLGANIPGAGFLFWAILGGITYVTAATIKNSPKHH